MRNADVKPGLHAAGRRRAARQRTISGVEGLETCFWLVTKTVVLAALLMALPGSRASAQISGEPDPEKVRMRLGPLMMNPTISLTNAGVDNNVFNAAAGDAPKRDFTVTVTPATDFWLRFGPTWVTGNIKEDIVWYQQYSSERAANTSYGVGWRVPASRVVLQTGVTYLNARDRPGFEIDARSERNELGYSGKLELRTFSSMSLVANASRLRVDYDKDAAFLGANLQRELNRVSTTLGGGLEYQVSTLTSFSLNLSRMQDQFEFSPLRDSNSNVATFGVEFKPDALIKGSATIGYRDFRPASADLAAFKGTTAAVNLSCSLFDMTRIAVIATRDIQYSYDVNQPYYLQNGAELSIAQQIFGPLDVVGRLGQQSLAYRDRTGAEVQAPDRVDRVHRYGGGVGYHLGKELRLGINVDKYNRRSVVASRQYDDLRIGSSLTYGF